jgi:DNA transformation protein
MSRNSGFLQYILEEVLSDIEGLTSRGMFGGYGLYKNGVIFGMIIEDQLYFKVNDTTRHEYIQKESKPFMYEGKNKKQVSLNYYTVPSEVMEDREEIQLWVEKAYSVCKSAKK